MLYDVTFIFKVHHVDYFVLFVSQYVVFNIENGATGIGSFYLSDCRLRQKEWTLELARSPSLIYNE